VKYKQIKAAIHNLGHSFASASNFVDGGLVVGDLRAIHALGSDIDIDFLTGEFRPPERSTPRITRSLRSFRDRLAEHFGRHGIDLAAIRSLHFSWPNDGRKCMISIDDRGKEHQVFISESG
jgi:hypothetical protein